MCFVSPICISGCSGVQCIIEVFNAEPDFNYVVRVVNKFCSCVLLKLYTVIVLKVQIVLYLLKCLREDN